MTEHLTADTRTRYLRGALAPDEFLEADDHLAGCAACRDSMALPVARVAESFLEALHGPHLTYEQLEALADGGQDASGHILLCALCAAELDDLRARNGGGSPAVPPAAGAPASPPWWSWAAAAAVAAAVLGSLLAVRQPQLRPRAVHIAPPAHVETGVTPSRNGLTPVSTPLPEELRGVLRQLAEGVLASAALLDDFRAGTERTRGAETAAASLTVLSPLGIIEDARPLFRWTARGGATYVTEVFDERYRSVARSEPVYGGVWRPERALARGAEYSWQVTETRGGDTVTAPEPPAPPARFRIISAAAAAELENAQTPLARALIYAREGVVDRALEEMQNVRDATPEVRRAIETLRRYQAAPTTTNPPQ